MTKGMNRYNSKSIAAFSVSLLSLFLILYGCSSGEISADDYDPEGAYAEAVTDANIAEPSEISRNLTAIIGYNEDLTWEGEPGNSRVLVVTWTDKGYYDSYVGQEYLLPDSANVWVTVVPELKKFFSDNNISSEEIQTLRIEQLLGLPPDSGKTKFIELWVNPKDLFRPSPDPEITDSEASLEFPTTGSRFLTFDDNAIIVEYDWDEQTDKSYTYSEWFNLKKDTMYQGDYAYPWTRLGYTYDWGNPDSEIGLSEFIILGGSTVGVYAIMVTSDYFQ